MGMRWDGGTYAPALGADSTFEMKNSLAQKKKKKKNRKKTTKKKQKKSRFRAFFYFVLFVSPIPSVSLRTTPFTKIPVRGGTDCIPFSNLYYHFIFFISQGGGDSTEDL